LLSIKRKKLSLIEFLPLIMNIKITALTLLVSCISTVTFAQYPYKQKLGGIARVMLPDSPSLQRVSGINIYMINQNGVGYTAAIADAEGGPLDLLKNNNVDSVYESYIRGTLKRTNSKTFYKNKIKITGLDAVEFGYKTIVNGYDTYVYQRAVCLNDSLAICSISASNLLPSTDKNLKVFFDGFKVLNAWHARQDISSLDYKWGKVTHYLLFLCIPILIGLGIVFLIRSIVYRKENE
jgi:hypothetical protein